jgi:hypothetical protein
MFNALTNVAHAAHWAHDTDDAGAKTDATAKQASSEPAHTQSHALPGDEEAILRAQGEEALRNFQAGKAHYVAEAARIAHLPKDEHAVLDVAGQEGLDAYQTGKARVELAAKRMADLPPDEQNILRYQGELALKNYQAGKARAALKQDERAVLDALGEQALSDLRQGKSYATLPKDQQAVLHGAGEQALHGYQTGRAVAALRADERAIYEVRGEEGLRDFHAGQARALLPKDEHAVLDAAGEEGLREYQARKADAALTDHDRALLRANQELQNEALIQETLKGRTILAGDNWSVLHIADKFTDYVLPAKAAIKAAVSGDFEDAMVLAGPVLGPPDMKRGLWDAEKDMAWGIAEQGAKAALGPIVSTVERGSALIDGDLAGAFPEVAGVIQAPFAIYDGLQKIADGDIRGGVREAAPAVLTLAPILEPLAMHPSAPRAPARQAGVRGSLVGNAGTEASQLGAKVKPSSIDPSSEIPPASTTPSVPRSESFDPSKTRVVANASDGMGRNFQVVAPGEADTPRTGPPRGPEGLSADLNVEPNSQTRGGSAPDVTPEAATRRQGPATHLTDVNDGTVTSRIASDGTVQLTHGNKLSTISLNDVKGNAEKVARELGITKQEATLVLREAREVLIEVRSTEPQAPKLLISMAQQKGDPRAYLLGRLHDPYREHRLSSDAFSKPPTEGTRLKARVPGDLAPDSLRLSEYGYVFEEMHGGQFESKGSETAGGIREYQYHEQPGGDRNGSALTNPRAVVRVNDAGVIVEIVDVTRGMTRDQLIALFDRNGWKYKLD